MLENVFRVHFHVLDLNYLRAVNSSQDDGDIMMEFLIFLISYIFLNHVTDKFEGLCMVISIIKIVNKDSILCT